MVLPPVDTGATNATLACVLPAVATGLVGAPETVIGVTADVAVDANEFPAALIATTVNVYAVPLVNPETTIGELAPVLKKPPGEDVTM